MRLVIVNCPHFDFVFSICGIGFNICSNNASHSSKYSLKDKNIIIKIFLIIKVILSYKMFILEKLKILKK